MVMLVVQISDQVESLMYKAERPLALASTTAAAADRRNFPGFS
jgi:hypothetical protein